MYVQQPAWGMLGDFGLDAKQSNLSRRKERKKSIRMSIYLIAVFDITWLLFIWQCFGSGTAGSLDFWTNGDVDCLRRTRRWNWAVAG